ncbi:MAG: cobalt-precorrin-5B (C(1))-methyltransferase [Nitrospirae bacterium]|nr:cobalt-precorrin-5B (C(1))-methyltransferase [Nitrospirota bacterium]
MSIQESRQGLASRNRPLRSGYTTGACAAAAAKAAAFILLNSGAALSEVEIPFPNGSRHKFRIHESGFRSDDGTAFASVIKDAGDDPDVTNGAEVIAEVRRSSLPISSLLLIKGGKGVGRVTKPGLSVPVGEAAINPVPRQMIREAVEEAINKIGVAAIVEVTILVTNGEELAKKTLNSRLGIVGGISILGTTGIVKPLSAEAWTASIKSAMDVAQAVGCDEIVLSSGRTSEKAHIKEFGFPEEAYVMMGDYLEFSFKEAAAHGFKKIHLCAQWAKMLKIAMGIPQTHVRHGVIELRKSVELLKGLGIKLPEGREFNTAREIYEQLISTYQDNYVTFFEKVCSFSKKTTEQLTNGIPVTSHLVSYAGLIIANSE